MFTCGKWYIGYDGAESEFGTYKELTVIDV